MVSSCKICGARTAGHRQYCPRCRRTHKGNPHWISKSGKDQEKIIALFVFVSLGALAIYGMGKFVELYWKAILVFLIGYLIIAIVYFILRLKFIGIKNLKKYDTFILALAIFFIIILSVIGMESLSNHNKQKEILEMPGDKISSQCNALLRDYCISLQTGDERYTEYNFTNLGLFESKEEILIQTNNSYKEISIKPNTNFINNLSSQDLPFIVGKCYYKHWVCYYGSCRFEGDTQLIFCNRYGIKK